MLYYCLCILRKNLLETIDLMGDRKWSCWVHVHMQSMIILAVIIYYGTVIRCLYVRILQELYKKPIVEHIDRVHHNVYAWNTGNVNARSNSSIKKKKRKTTSVYLFWQRESTVYLIHVSYIWRLLLKKYMSCITLRILRLFARDK